MAIQQISDVTTNALRGGATTVRSKASLQLGEFSEAQNVRGKHPGFEKRKGQRKLHSANYGANEVMNLYQFNKSRVSETHFYAQMDDGILLEATNQAPTVTVGSFGSTVFSGTETGQIPASFGNMNDILVYSNGVDQHQIYGGTSSVVSKFMVYTNATSIEFIPDEGKDYSIEVSDGRSTTYAVLDSLNTIDDFECIFIQTPIQANGIGFTMYATNTTSGILQVDYWDGTDWTIISEVTDGTAVTNAPLGKDGSVTFDVPSDMKERYLYGSNGWWYRISLSEGSFDNDTKVEACTYQSEMHDLVNVWDGVPVDGVEVQVFDVSDDSYYLYGSMSVDVEGIGVSDYIYVACSDPAIGFYIDPGSVPNTTSTSFDTVEYWTGNAWTSVASLNDYSNGAQNPGWIIFDPQTDVEPRQFQGSLYYAYWYRIVPSATISDDTNIGIQFMPVYDINDLGKSQSNCVWKSRIVYSFDRWGEYIYIGATNAPYVLNGSDYGILEVGDGRSNKVVAMRRFHNELMVWQEEIGEEGGCVTLIEGYTPSTFGKLLLSSRIGAMNNKSVVVVDGVLTATATDESVKTLAFFLSRYGVCACDGRVIQILSDDIQNYFNANKPECIRRGYEDQMWLNHDSSENVLRMGLVSGDNATTCNVFPVYDLIDKCWYFDDIAQELSCMTNVGAETGTETIVQVGGGVDDGTVYQLNYGNNDVTTAIETFLTIEFGNIGKYITLREFVARWESQELGELYLEVLVNNVSKARWNCSLHPERYEELTARIRKSVSFDGHQISIKIGNFEADRSLYLIDLGMELYVWNGR